MGEAIFQVWYFFARFPLLRDKNHASIGENGFDSSIESQTDNFLRPVENPLARVLVGDRGVSTTVAGGFRFRGLHNEIPFDSSTDSSS